jgi:putative SOS response-associated peptidase YedK
VNNFVGRPTKEALFQAFSDIDQKTGFASLRGDKRRLCYNAPMCGRYVSPDAESIEEAWPIAAHIATQALRRRFNVLPGSMVPVLRGEGARAALVLIQARWGFIPPWWKQPKPPPDCFNARSEDAAAKPMWRAAYRSARCLIPADGWYEWSGVERIDPRTGTSESERRPHFIFRPQGPICFAGLMSLWKLEGRMPLITCAILTRPASASLRGIHPRMPVVLPEELYRDWLSPRLEHAQRIAELIAQSMSDFSHYPVSMQLNHATEDAEELVHPIGLGLTAGDATRGLSNSR